MAGFVPFGQNLQLQSGVPLAKVASVFMEKLSVTKRLDGGSVQGVVAKVLQDGNLSSVMQNPMSVLTGAVQGQLGGLVSQLQGMVGGAPAGLVDALTGSSGLGNAMGVLKSAGDNLAGLTNGAQGFFSMIGHSTFVDMAGPALSSLGSMASVTAPLTSGDFLSTVAKQVPSIVSQVVNGSITPTAATSLINGHINTAAQIVSGSAGALAYGEQMHAMVATVSSVAGSLAVPPVFDAAGNRFEGAATGFQGVLASIVQPVAKTAMDAALAAQIAHTPPTKVDTAAMTSLEG